MEQIKLVIWDLDETFWDGTLSEGEIKAKEKNITIVKELTSRGIINSICSKNNLEQAKEKLTELEIWDYFVFPSISWKPKGPQVKQIIENCQLRAENILFLDDNHLNREEVKYYNKNIKAKEPKFIWNHINDPPLLGKNDKNHSRLKQYKLLEQKLREKETYSSNLNFLRDSNIRLIIIKELAPIKDRIHELISRTNQLNFTKHRLNKTEVGELLNDSAKDQFAVRVKDKFGDYGIVGYVCYNPVSNTLEHFVFSCRILNLGVPQYIYQKLGYPDIDVQGDVAISLEDQSGVDWISEIDVRPSQCTDERAATESNTKLLFTGSCELGSVLSYLKAYSKHIMEHTVTINEDNLPEFPDHILTILNSSKLEEHKLNTLAKLPFLNKGYSLSGRVTNANYDVLIYSVVANYGQNIYRHKNDGFYLAWGEYDQILTDANPKSKMTTYLRSRNMNAPEQFLKRFSDQYEHIGLMKPEWFLEAIKELRNLIPKQIPIIFINGSEVNPSSKDEPIALKRHIEMNKTLDHFLADATNCYLVDMRKIASGLPAMGKSIRHFKRHIYKEISEEIILILKTNIGKNLHRDIYKDLSVKYRYHKRRLYRKIVSNKLLYNKFTASIYRATIKKLVK